MDLKMLSKGHVLVFGDIILDRYISGSVDRVSPEAPVPVLKPSGEEIRLGGAANVAVNLNNVPLSNVRKRFCVSNSKLSDALNCLKETILN